MVFSSELRTFQVPAGGAEQTLKQFAAQAKVSIVFDPGRVAGERTHEVNGRMIPQAALQAMLAGTPLEFCQDAETGAFAVTRKESKEATNPTQTPNHPGDTMNPQTLPSTQSKSAPEVLPPRKPILNFLAAAFALALPVNSGYGQEEEVIEELSPFVVDASKDTGYIATETLAGTRIRTNLADIGSSISVLTEEFLRDINGTNNETTLMYAVNTEVGGARGNFSGGVVVTGQNTNELALFANPNGNTRVRGLTVADNTRNFFLSDIPWDGYTVSRVDLQRGPNAILFGLGSPAGVVNTTIDTAVFQNEGEAGFQIDGNGSRRYTLEYNREIMKEQLAVRVAGLMDERRFQQKPAYSDDKRLFGTVRYRPEWLNKNGMTFEVSANYEQGSIDSNRPRILAPLDQLSAWWAPEALGGLNKQTFNPFLVRNLTDRNHADYLAALGGYRSASLVVDALSGSYSFTLPSKIGALAPDGHVILTTSDNAPGPFPQSNSYSRLTQRGFHEWASSASLPFSDFGGYDPATMTDESVFNFYERLVDGTNKGEWTDWDVYDLSLTQTFLNDQVGYNLAYFEQSLDRGQWAALGWQNRILIDVNEINMDGMPNPNLGRAFIEEELRDTNNTGTSARDAFRLQVFAQHDFAKNRQGWLFRLLGEQRLTGLISQENQKRDQRGIKGASPDTASMALFTDEPYIEGANGGFHVGFRYYLSDDLRSRGSASGLGLPGMDSSFMVSKGGQVPIRYFDTTWIAPATVIPSDPWTSPDPYDTDPNRLTQASNPANYRGWTTRNANMVTFFTEGTLANGLSARDYLTSNAQLSEFNVDSLNLVWQGYFWDHSVVGTYGYRKDEARSYIWETGYRAGNYRPDSQGADLDPARYHFSNPNADVRELETETNNWSVALHVNRLLGKRDFIPLNLSLYYNEGENFSPLAGRIDAFRLPLPPPSGKTREYSGLLATKDGRYHLRVTNYKTEVENGTTTGSIGNMWALEQQLGFTANLARDFRSGRVSWSDHSSDPAQQARLQNVILPAWFQFEQDLAAQFPDYVKAWMGENTPFGTTSNNNVSASAPAGFSYTENSISEGWEFEFTANPTPNWRVALNASKAEASRTEVPGVAFKSVADFVDERMMTTDAGLAPIWWPGNTFGSRNFGPYPWNFRPDYLKLKALNGQSTPEVRKWRANLITSYDFNSGKLKGAGIGGAYRWEDDAVIDYAPMKNADGSNGINLNAPFTAPGHDTVDLWINYRFKIRDDLEWRIQLNVYNVFGENELVPISASVDPIAIQALATITPDSVIPMQGSAFLIREGLSWTLSNTLEF